VRVAVVVVPLDVAGVETAAVADGGVAVTDRVVVSTTVTV
jgi:hypothetical protein